MNHNRNEDIINHLYHINKQKPFISLDIMVIIEMRSRPKSPRNQHQSTQQRADRLRYHMRRVTRNDPIERTQQNGKYRHPYHLVYKQL